LSVLCVVFLLDLRPSCCGSPPVGIRGLRAVAGEYSEELERELAELREEEIQNPVERQLHKLEGGDTEELSFSSPAPPSVSRQLLQGSHEQHRRMAVEDDEEDGEEEERERKTALPSPEFFSWPEDGDDTNSNICSRLKASVNTGVIGKRIRAEMRRRVNAEDPREALSQAEELMRRKILKGLMTELEDKCPIDQVINIDPCEEVYTALAGKTARNVVKSAEARLDEIIKEKRGGGTESVSPSEVRQIVKDVLSGELDRLASELCDMFPKWRG